MISFEALGYSHVRQLANGEFAGIVPLTFGRARVCVGLSSYGHRDSY